MPSYKFMIDSKNKNYRIITPEARGSYMQAILVPEAFDEGDKEEWSCQLRFPKDGPEIQEWANEMKKLFIQILTDRFGKDKAVGMLKSPTFKLPLRNGDNEEKEEYHGNMFMNVRNKFRQPVIIGPTGKAVPSNMIDDNLIYSGAYYRAKISFAYYDVKSKGIGAYVEVLMKLRDGDRLDNVISVAEAESDFSEFADPDAVMETAGEPEEDQVASSSDDDFDFL